MEQLYIEAKVLFFARWKICKLVYAASEEKRKLALEHRAAITYSFHENRSKTAWRSYCYSFSIRSSVLNVILEITIIYELSIMDRFEFRIAISRSNNYHDAISIPYKCLFTYYLLNRSLSLNYFHGSISVIYRWIGRCVLCFPLSRKSVSPAERIPADED